jgi:hypothetical protein
LEGLESGAVRPVPLQGRVKQWVDEHWKQKVEAFNNGLLDDDPLPTVNNAEDEE